MSVHELDADSTDTLDVKKPRRKVWPWIVVAVVLILLIGGYVWLAFATQGRMPSTTTVEGVDVSGKNVDQAVEIVDEELTERAHRTVSVTVEDSDLTATLVPAEAGFSFDAEETLGEYRDLSFNPVVIWNRIFGETHLDAATSLDDTAALAELEPVAEELSVDPTEGTVAFSEGEVNYTEPDNGLDMTGEEILDELRSVWLTETEEVVVEGTVLHPVVSAETWETFVADVAEPLVAGPYEVTAPDRSGQITAAQLGEAATVTVPGDDASDEAEESPQSSQSSGSGEPAPTLTLSAESLYESLTTNSDDFVASSRNATVRLAGSAGSGQPEVVPAQTGEGIDPDELKTAIEDDLAGEQTRTVALTIETVEPEISTEEAEAWDVNHVVAEYDTPYPYDPSRTVNLRVGAERVNGTVVLPGEEFNLNNLLAPVTTDNGYASSGVVESGVTSNAVGGGLSQIATMSYNAGFLGGMDIVEHKPHSRYFDRYPMGRESTYWEGQINVRWLNDTNAPVIVEMWLSDDSVHTRLWGNDYYDVTTNTSEPYNYTGSPTIENSDSECIPESGGRRGFTVDVTRSRTDPSGNTDNESWSWAYTGWPRVICTG